MESEEGDPLWKRGTLWTIGGEVFLQRSGCAQRLAIGAVPIGDSGFAGYLGDEFLENLLQSLGSIFRQRSQNVTVTRQEKHIDNSLIYWQIAGIGEWQGEAPGLATEFLSCI